MALACRFSANMTLTRPRVGVPAGRADGRRACGPVRRLPRKACSEARAVAVDDANSTDDMGECASSSGSAPAAETPATKSGPVSEARLRRKQQREREQLTYKVSAIWASLLILGIATGATYYRFFLTHDGGSELPVSELALTVCLVGVGVVGMEMYARWVHRVVWHEWAPGWYLHESHHTPRVGPFEANDIYAVANAVPAMSLCFYGFITPGMFGCAAFGLGLGITLFGMAYVFVHDGLVHRRFPVGPVANIPQLKRIALAHQLHHTEKYGGVPWGLFLGPQELEAVGGKEELDKMVKQADFSNR